MFGAIAAIFLFKFKESKFLKSNLTSELFSLIGIGCLVFSFFFFKESSFYQGVFSFSAVTGTLAIIGEEFGEELLSGLGGGAFIGIGFMIYRFFKVSIEIETQLEES